MIVHERTYNSAIPPLRFIEPLITETEQIAAETFAKGCTTMKIILIVTSALMAIAGWVAPVRSQETQTVTDPATTAQGQVTKEEIINACVQDRVETLPPLYADVPTDHWAYSAVQKISYCGPFRLATPPALIEKLIRSDDRQMPNRTQTQQPLTSLENDSDGIR